AGVRSNFFDFPKYNADGVIEVLNPVADSIDSAMKVIFASIVDSQSSSLNRFRICRTSSDLSKRTLAATTVGALASIGTRPLSRRFGPPVIAFVRPDVQNHDHQSINKSF